VRRKHWWSKKFVFFHSNFWAAQYFHYIFLERKKILQLFCTSNEPTKKSNCSTPLTYTSAVTLSHSERLAVLQVSSSLFNTNIVTASHKILLYDVERLWPIQPRQRRLEENTKVRRMREISNGVAFTMGHAVAQLVEALRYKPEGCGFDSRWCY
jgi:hypothetical protein